MQYPFIMLFLLLLFGFLHASEIELYCDYACDAKGQNMFPLEGEHPALPTLIRRQLVSRGDDIRSWEIDQYRPLLLNWHGVKTWQDFKHWLGIGLPKGEIVAPDTRYWVFWNLGPLMQDCNLAKVPKEKLVLVMWEPPAVQPELYDPKTHALFDTIFTWDDDLVDNQKFFKLHYPALNPRIANLPPFEEKKFCTMICRRLTSKHPKELYSERKRAIQFFEGKPAGEFDLYGYGWKKKYKNYRGSVPDKWETLKGYKFSICYENTKDVKGYISEKIFDCFATGVVPIYLGASNVTDYIPAECFIDRRQFASYEELYQFMKKMSPEEYQTYLDAADAFIHSEKAKVFTNDFFVENFLSKLHYGTGEVSEKLMMPPPGEESGQ
ncbi:MAG: hypothetical protein KGQ49_02355 [Verrucomicrobia bacterium]|nr:hypothetical protein [Verrucomicrobiota bacterium]